MHNENNDLMTVFVVALKGAKEALQQAYRRSVRMLAEFDKEFGADSQPDRLEFRWDWIDGYRVLIVCTDGAGITGSFSDIPGIEEAHYALYDYGAAIAQASAGANPLMLDKSHFRLPECDYEIIEWEN